MNKIIIFFLMFLSFAQAQKNPNPIKSVDQKIKHLMRLQDERDILEIGKYLKDTNPEVLKQAALALANLQDTIAVPLLSEISSRQSEEDKIPFVFALGRIGPSSITGEYLFAELGNAGSSNLRTALYEALGRAGSPVYLDSLLSIPIQSNAEKFSKLTGIIRFAIRGIKNNSSIAYIVSCLNNDDEKVREKAAYALSRSSGPTQLKDYLEEIIPGLKKERQDAYLIINALMPLAQNDTLKQIFISYMDKDWKEQLSALKALEKYQLSKDDLNLVIKTGGSSNEHVRLALFRFLSKASLKDSNDANYVQEIIKGFLVKENLNWRERAELYISLANRAGEKALDDLIKESQSKNPLYNAKMIRAIGDINSLSAVNALLFKLNVSEPQPNMAQLEAISRLRTKVKLDTTEIDQIKNILLRSLKSKNIAVVTTAVIAANNNQFRNLIPFKEYASVYNRLKLPDDVEGILEFVKLFTLIRSAESISILEKMVNSESDAVSKTAIDNLYDLTGKEYSRSTTEAVKTKNSYYDFKYLEKITKNPFIEIVTGKGKIKIELFPKDAPFTCMSICKLIDRKYFDKLIFHRVVSNFVIQGGDPMGTGWGGPGYSIRTEISQQTFGTGYLGMASAGKDTEGSQFFITHSPQSHLDGRYTVFGKVVEGMDVVNIVQEGDRMVSVRRIR